jgi:hypothetical protein
MKKVVIIIMVISEIICGCQKANSKIDAASVQNDINAHLPIGSSKANVIAFLDDRKIIHDWFQKPTMGPNGQKLSPDTHTEEGFIPNVREDGWFLNSTSTSIYIYFKFDNNDSNLVSFSVREAYTGL